MSSLSRLLGLVVVPVRTIPLLVAVVLLLGCNEQPGRHPPDPATPQAGGTVVQVPGDFTDNPSVLSPPVLHLPLLECAGAVTVSGFVPGAKIEIFANGTAIGDGIGDSPDGQSFSVSPALVSTETITATQTWGGVTSGPSDGHTVVKHTDYYEAGLPKPDLKEPLYACGIQTAVFNLPPGGSVEVLQDGTRVGFQSTGVGVNQAVRIDPPFEEPREVIARGAICTDPTPDSDPEIVQPAPASLPAPEAEDVYEDSDRIVLWNMVNGANATISRGGTVIGGGGASGGGQVYRLSQVIHPGEVLELVQELCGVPSPTGTVTVKPCSELPGVTVVRAVAGEDHIHLADVLPGSRIQVLAGGVEIGDGGGSQVQLTRPLVLGETLIVIQTLGDCVSSEAYQVEVGTGLIDPGAPGSCQFDRLEYGDGLTTDVSSFFNSPAWCVAEPMSAVPLHGIARIPRGPGRYPLAMVVHGNHAAQEASEPGYVYLLEQLASHCIIAVSVDENFLNLCADPWNQVSGEMDARAVVLLRHLQLWRGWDQDPGHELYGKVDHDKVMLMGHSRGGEAITVAAKLNQWLHDPSDPELDFDFGIRSLYAIAPVVDQIGGDASVPLTGLPIDQPLVIDEANYFVIHGSHDGDVAEFDGHKTFDRAFPVTADADHFKGLLFVHGANHAQFNSVWVSSPDHSTAIADADVLAINKTYATAFAFATLKGWDGYRALFKGEVTFPSLPGGTRVAQYQDPEREFLNHYEEDDDLATGSRPGVSNQPVNTLDPYEDIDFHTGAVDHWLWQDTDGLALGWLRGTDRELVVNLPSGLGAQTSSHPYLGFRVGQVFDPMGTRNPAGVDKDLSVRLHFADGSTTPAVRVSGFARLPYPVPVTAWGGQDKTKTIMSSVRIPWSSFAPEGEDLPWNDLDQIRFAFDRHSEGLLVLDEIQLTQ